MIHGDNINQSEDRAIMIVMRHDPSHSSQYDPCFASPGSVTRGKNSRDFVSRDIVCEAWPDPGDIRQGEGGPGPWSDYS